VVHVVHVVHVFVTLLLAASESDRCTSHNGAARGVQISIRCATVQSAVHFDDVTRPYTLMASLVRAL
jgi:hypothetical protein